MRVINYCKSCGKELKFYNKRNKRYSYYKTKNDLCKNCFANDNYSRRGSFTHNHGKLWSEDEIKKLRKLYPNYSSSELSKIFKRPNYSIMHKANRLKIYKSKNFWKTHPIITIKKFTSKNNPMNKKEIRIKCSLKHKEGYRNGSIKLSGIALKSKLGLTKKENHPNWLGGISFEPYDKNFDKKFCISIRKRDNFCMICGKSNKDELLNINQSLCVHHIDYNKKNTYPENCISLCNSCHAKTNYNRSSWIKFFQNMMSDRYGYEYN